ncbi:conjugal transfer protein TraD [Mesorhizobium sp. ORM6]
MRKPRDFDAELYALEEKARELKTRKVQQLGELVIATGADQLGTCTDDEPGDRPMTRHGPSGHTPALRRRGSTEAHVRFAVARVSRDPNHTVLIPTGLPTRPEGYFLDALTAPRADVRDRRWHTSKHKSP